MAEQADGYTVPEQPDLVKQTSPQAVHVPDASGDGPDKNDTSTHCNGPISVRDDHGADDTRSDEGEEQEEEAGAEQNEEYMLDEKNEELNGDDVKETSVDDFDGSDDGFVPFPSSYLIREEVTELPSTVTKLVSEHGGTVYLVGTAHFSISSQQDVAQTIQAVKPDAVVIELCESRSNILHMDEERIMKEAKEMNFEKMRFAIRQSGLLQGVMHILLLSMSAHLTEELGMAPGGEFRKAFSEAQMIEGCRVHLGDRPIQITLTRALSTLSWWQWIKLAWHMITSKDSISKEDVERCKQKDLLQEMLREMTGEFPALSHVFVNERDAFLANSLRLAALPVPHPTLGCVPPVVVGVVGIGHVEGIVQNWQQPVNIKQLLTVPKRSLASGAIRWTMKAVLVGVISWGCYKGYTVGRLLF